MQSKGNSFLSKNIVLCLCYDTVDIIMDYSKIVCLSHFLIVRKVFRWVSRFIINIGRRAPQGGSVILNKICSSGGSLFPSVRLIQIITVSSFRITRLTIVSSSSLPGLSAIMVRAARKCASVSFGICAGACVRDARRASLCAFRSFAVSV